MAEYNDIYDRDRNLTGRVHRQLEHVMIYPASHYVVPQEKINAACVILFLVFAALVILFLILVFFSLLSDALGYFVSLYREIVFRLH